MPIAALRASDADPRERHRGVSHHSVTALTTATRSRITVAVPAMLPLDKRIAERHDVVRVDPLGIVELMADHGLEVASMGRTAADDPILFECGAAAGTVAAHQVP
jgi:hypothetical protein